MRAGTASEHSEMVGTLPSVWPFVKVHTSCPQSLLPVLSFHLLSPPSIFASNSCPIFVQLLLSLTMAHSLLLLLLPVRLSFSISSISIHLLLLSLCSFSLRCLGKNGYWLCLLFPHIPALLSPPPIIVYSSSTCSFLGGDVKSSTNAPCKGKKGDDTISFTVP